MKKLLKLMMILFLVTACSKPKTEVEDIQITLHIKIVDEISDSILLDEDVSVEGKIETLADFLKNASKMQAELSKGSYGLQLDGLMGLKTENWNTGPWWIYDSENNKSCVEMGMCDALSSLKVEDGDSFIFTFTKSF